MFTELKMSRRYRVLMAIMLLCTTMMAQTEDVIVQPQFPGGRKELLKYMEEHMVYPAEMRRLNKTGEVVVEFFVERNGVISGVNVVKGICKELDDEAIRLTRYMPLWEPGTKNGVPVRYKMTMPINFKIKRKRDKYEVEETLDLM
jgi:TonB family protein